LPFFTFKFSHESNFTGSFIAIACLFGIWERIFGSRCRQFCRFSQASATLGWFPGQRSRGLSGHRRSRMMQDQLIRLANKPVRRQHYTRESAALEGWPKTLSILYGIVNNYVVTTCQRSWSNLNVKKQKNVGGKYSTADRISDVLGYRSCNCDVDK